MSKLISGKYRELNAQLHAEHPGYGASGWMWVGPLLRFMAMTNSNSILDYGCGKATLQQWFPPGFKVSSYDPAVPAHAADPDPADFVACLDVLEHIEPPAIDDVLAHMRSKAINAAFVTIALDAATKKLPDGRNAHLLIKPCDWWGEKLMKHWKRSESIPVFGKNHLNLLLWA